MDMLTSRSLIAPLCLCFSVATNPPLAEASDMKTSLRCEPVMTLSQSAKASWYGPGFHGRKTANGEVFNMHAMTAAHKTLKLGTRVLVSNLENGAQAVLRINDRGPYKGGRSLDVSRRAADVLGFRDDGLARVRLTICAD